MIQNQYSPKNFLCQSLLVIFSINILLEDALAATNGHHGTMKDLIPPMVNFLILLGLLIYKTKDNLKKYFENYSHLVQASAERAEARSKEAYIKYDMYERKLKDLDGEREVISKSMENDFINFSKNHKTEIQKKVEKLRLDSIQRLEKEKSDYIKKINEEFLNSIIHKATSTIDSNKDIQQKITQKILKAIKA